MFSHNRDLLDTGDMILITAEDNYMVNALQRVAAVVMQKSLKEGFGLTVTEAMWKAKPMIASRVGGIPNQIEHNKNGILVNPTDFDECADAVIKVLKDEKFAKEDNRSH